MRMTEADSQNTNSLTSCTTLVTVPTQVHSFLLVQMVSAGFNSCTCCFNIVPAPRLSPGEVLASTIVHYLHSMTAQSPGQDRLVSLGRLLDPDCQDCHVSRETFHACMTEWISQCSQDRWSDGVCKLAHVITALWFCFIAVGVELLKINLNMSSKLWEALPKHNSVNQTKFLYTFITQFKQYFYQNVKLCFSHWWNCFMRSIYFWLPYCGHI